MSRRELFDAHQAGPVGRKSFVRRLTALGVSAGAALSYALASAPGAGAQPSEATQERFEEIQEECREARRDEDQAQRRRCERMTQRFCAQHAFESEEFYFFCFGSDSV